MRSRTLDAIDTGLAWAEDTKYRTERWLKAHLSWAYRSYYHEEQLTLTLSFTGRLRERARQAAIARIKRRMLADGADGPYITGDGLEYQIRVNQHQCPDWLADLPQTGKVRTPAFDDAAVAAAHYDSERHRGPAPRR